MSKDKNKWMVDKETSKLQSKNKESRGFNLIILLLIVILITQIAFNFSTQFRLDEIEHNFDKLEWLEENNYKETRGPVDYERIENIIDDKIGIDYGYIEDIVQANQANVEKDFGEKFEDMTQYFGYRFKEIVSDVNEKINE